MENLCRLCSSHSLCLTPVFSIKNGRLLLDIISIICPIKIDISDNLPKAICSLCLKIILDAVDLRERSVLSDLSLRSRGIPSKIIEQPKIIEHPKTQDDSSSKNSSFSLPMDAVKVEDEKMEESVINYVDESQTSHEDFQSYDPEQSYHDNQSDYADYGQPPAKLLKIETDQKCTNCQCHKASVINHEVNEKIKEYFRRPLHKGGKWKCHLCQKEYAGHLNNLKEHLSIMHKDIAQMLGVTLKPRPRQLEKIMKKAQANSSEFHVQGSFSEYFADKDSN